MSRTGSLRGKIMLVVMSATCAALLLSACALLAYEIGTYRSERASDLRSQAELVALSLAPALSFDDPKAAHDALAALSVRPQIRAAAVFTASGRPFASYRAVASAAPADAAAVPSLPASDGEYTVDGGLALVQPILQHGMGGERLGTLYLRARHDLWGRIVGYLWILAGASLAGLGLAALIFRKLHPAITRPIAAMADVSRRVMDERNYDLRVSRTSDDEIGVLVDAFNNMLRDLSAEMKERQAAEEALRAADRRKDEFLATLAHELRNPLAPLTNALAILQRADHDPALRRTTQALMGRQLAQMVRLIDDLLEVSRITRGELELRLETVDVGAVALRALEAAEPMLSARQHQVETALPPQPAWVRADPARLTQVFVNLLHNAAKYTDRQGLIALGVHATDAAVQVTVRDNGIGIDPQQQQAIFDMFVQVDKSLERGNAGLGVGLTIARQLVRLHGGLLEVRSDGLGQGATFSVTLPAVLTPALPAGGATPVPVPAAAASKQVLIADDNVDFAASLADVLTLEGHAVRVVNDGARALLAARAQPPEVAFLDIGMPGLNGYELARQLRADAGTRGTLLVAVTGWGQASDKQQARDAGFDLHLVKPIDLQHACDLLRSQARV